MWKKSYYQFKLYNRRKKYSIIQEAMTRPLEKQGDRTLDGALLVLQT